jgi:hypothetical protein
MECQIAEGLRIRRVQKSGISKCRNLVLERSRIQVLEEVQESVITEVQKSGLKGI